MEIPIKSSRAALTDIRTPHPEEAPTEGRLFGATFKLKISGGSVVLPGHSSRLLVSSGTTVNLAMSELGRSTISRILDDPDI
jgi:hypothetical protein